MSNYREAVMGVVAREPGATHARVVEVLAAAGLHNRVKNEPSNTLWVLIKQGRVRAEGVRPKTYFSTGKPARPSGGSMPGAGRKPLATKVQAPEAIAVAAPTVVAQPAVAAPAVAAARAAPVVTTDADQARLDLAEAVMQHLGLAEDFDSAEQIATDLGEERYPVAMAIALLVRQGRITRKADATGRWVYRDRRPGDGADAVRAAPAAAAEAVSQPPAAEVAKAELAEPVSYNGNSGPGNFAAVPASRPDKTRMTAAEFAGIEKFLDIVDTEQGPLSLPAAIGLELTALDDLLGEACDAQAPHAAIKLLITAQGALRRAVGVLQPAAA